MRVAKYKFHSAVARTHRRKSSWRANKHSHRRRRRCGCRRNGDLSSQEKLAAAAAAAVVGVGKSNHTPISHL